MFNSVYNHLTTTSNQTNISIYFHQKYINKFKSIYKIDLIQFSSFNLKQAHKTHSSCLYGHIRVVE